MEPGGKAKLKTQGKRRAESGQMPVSNKMYYRTGNTMKSRDKL